MVPQVAVIYVAAVEVVNVTAVAVVNFVAVDNVAEVAGINVAAVALMTDQLPTRVGFMKENQKSTLKLY